MAFVSCGQFKTSQEEQDKAIQKLKEELEKKAISAEDELLDKSSGVGGGKVTVEKIKAVLADSLKIARDGLDGKSAYDIWIEQGNVGSELDFLRSLYGRDGKDGVDGQNGVDGKDGKDGTKGQKGDQGIQGEKGEGFEIFKTYDSIEAMNADKNNVLEGKFVLIATNVDDEDNAKLFVKGENDFAFLTDLSGAQGIKGERGLQGIQGIPGKKGEKGDKGDTGTFDVNLLALLVDNETIKFENGKLQVIFPASNGGISSGRDLVIGDGIISCLIQYIGTEYNAYGAVHTYDITYQYDTSNVNSSLSTISDFALNFDYILNSHMAQGAIQDGNPSESGLLLTSKPRGFNLKAINGLIAGNTYTARIKIGSLVSTERERTVINVTSTPEFDQNKYPNVYVDIRDRNFSIISLLKNKQGNSNNDSSMDGHLGFAADSLNIIRR